MFESSYLKVGMKILSLKIGLLNLEIGFLNLEIAKFYELKCHLSKLLNWSFKSRN